MTETRGPVHLIGIGGIHMSAIGQLLREQGVAVSGSDLRPSSLTEKLAAMGATVAYGHAAANVPVGTALVVTTAAAADDNPELGEARRRGIPVLLRAEMVARLMEGKRVVAVSGAHGKTTTSSLIAHILVSAGREPMYLLGGESLDLGGHASWGKGDICVVEADEYKRAFHEYTPDIAIILNVEPDHLDYYGTAAAYRQAFVEFGKKVKEGGIILACADDPGAREVSDILSDDPIRQETYGIEGVRYWMAGDVRMSDGGADFEVTRGGTPIGRMHAKVPGEHFVRNALAATAACLHLDVPFDTIAAAVATFRGARRRFERIGEAGGVLVMDDYAHHPSEVKATIAAALRAFPERRIIGVHQPHTYSRISYLWDDWLTCWDGLSALVVLETYAAREKPLPGYSAADLAAAIRGVETVYASDFDDAAAKARALARRGDVVFTIGAGDVVEVGPKLLELLR
ncbi:UDP-N-acetylmuramate--L-alanine ligase [Candidatus Amarobacter glycogenicus]|uniref:UDP-N-acetylmuramate--L-alanine ligase n=1 Tax=Candidatus Amarobacter glycogenicus TaxID=3140699 RepID=UPI00313540D6|nr:UDP-N-acetylmuramate--L-alanine ligase [Dehalococcoidia bacterium]